VRRFIVADKTVVTPWAVTGEIDYDKLIERFGTKRIDRELLERIRDHTGTLHMHLRRGIFYSHRDMDRILDEHEKGNRFVLYTGRGPSGPVHLGHLVPWLFTKHLQDVFGAKLFFQFTDDEKLMLRPEFNEADTWHWVYENSLDLMALGFDPDKTEFIVNLRHPEKVYPLAIQIAKKTTISTIKAVFGFTGDTSTGLMFFPSIQAAPCFIESYRTGEQIPCLIPAGIDQDTYWRITRDVAQKLGYPKPAQIHGRILPGLSGEAKMSSSIPETAVYTTDSPEIASQKIMNAAHTPSHPERCPVYQYFFFLFEDSDSRMERRNHDCIEGKAKCETCKGELAERLTVFLGKHQNSREKMRDTVDMMLE